MTRRKPQRGCCGVCGCPVEAPSEQERWAAVGEVAAGGCWDRPILESGWARGHAFDETGKLVQVRCPQHGGHGWPVEPREVGDTGGLVLM